MLGSILRSAMALSGSLSMTIALRAAAALPFTILLLSFIPNDRVALIQRLFSPCRTIATEMI